MPVHRRFFSQTALAQRKGLWANHSAVDERGRQGRTSREGQLTGLSEVGPLKCGRAGSRNFMRSHSCDGKGEIEAGWLVFGEFEKWMPQASVSWRSDRSSLLRRCFKFAFFSHREFRPPCPPRLST